MKRKGEEGKIRGGNLGGSRVVGLLLGLTVEAQLVADLFIKWVRDPQPNQARGFLQGGITGSREQCEIDFFFFLIMEGVLALCAELISIGPGEPSKSPGPSVVAHFQTLNLYEQTVVIIQLN